MSMAKKAVDSTLRRILNYTAEIIISIILLITICIPLAFTIPMWFQHVFFNVPRPDLTINPALWWGLDGTLWITLLLGLVSISIGYLYIMKMNPGVVGDEKDDEEDEFSEDEDEESTTEESEFSDVDDVLIEDEEDIAAEDTPLEDQEEEEEEEESILDEIEDSIGDDGEEE